MRALLSSNELCAGNSIDAVDSSPRWGEQIVHTNRTMSTRNRCASLPMHLEEEGSTVADLIAIAYPDETTAIEAEHDAQLLADELAIQPDAIAAIVRTKDGKLKV